MIGSQTGAASVSAAAAAGSRDASFSESFSRDENPEAKEKRAKRRKGLGTMDT